MSNQKKKITYQIDCDQSHPRPVMDWTVHWFPRKLWNEWKIFYIFCIMILSLTRIFMLADTIFLFIQVKLYASWYTILVMIKPRIKKGFVCQLCLKPRASHLVCIYFMLFIDIGLCYFREKLLSFFQINTNLYNVWFFLDSFHDVHIQFS